MPAPDEPAARTRPGRRPGQPDRQSWIAVGSIALVSVAIVGAGFLGGSARRSAAPTPPAAGATRQASPRRRSAGRPVATAASGARLSRATPATRWTTPATAATGRSSRRPARSRSSASASGRPTAPTRASSRSTVGTPARGAPILFAGQTRFVYGDDARRAGRRATSVARTRFAAVRSAFGVDGGGTPARLRPHGARRADPLGRAAGPREPGVRDRVDRLRRDVPGPPQRGERGPGPLPRGLSVHRPAPCSRARSGSRFRSHPRVIGMA